MNPKINFLNFDIYAKRASFFYNNQERIGSYFGLFLTMLYIIASLILLCYYLISTIQRRDLKVYDSTLHAQEMPIIYLDKSNFNFAFGLEDPETLNRFVDETIYTAEVALIDKVKIDGQLVNSNVTILPLEKCKSEEDFGKNYKHLFLEGELSNSYCLKNFNYNLTLLGGFKYEKMSYIRIKIFPCKNNSENNYQCKPQEVLKNKMTSSYFSILLKDIGLNPSNFSFPTIPTLQDLYTTVDRRLSKNYILNFGLTEIQTDVGLVNEQIKKEKYIQFRKEAQTFSFRDESEFIEGKDICLVQIRLDDNTVVQKRAYTKISEILSHIGGYMQLINTAFVLLSLMMNKIDSELKIINSIFNFNLRKNKMSLKINSLILLNSMALNKNKSKIFTSKKSIRRGKTLQSESNLSNNNLIQKNNGNIASPMNIYSNKQIIRSPNNNLTNSNINNNNNNNSNKIISFASYIENMNKSLGSKVKYKNDEYINNNNPSFGDITPKINLAMNEKAKNSLKEYKENINLTLFDYFFSCGDKKKKRMIELYLFANSFYRRRMDIVQVFTHLMLTEKILIKNNFAVNKDKYLYP
jgi:uncharacterized membrane protein